MLRPAVDTRPTGRTRLVGPGRGKGGERASCERAGAGEGKGASGRASCERAGAVARHLRANREAKRPHGCRWRRGGQRVEEHRLWGDVADTIADVSRKCRGSVADVYRGRCRGRVSRTCRGRVADVSRAGGVDIQRRLQAHAGPPVPDQHGGRREPFARQRARRDHAARRAIVDGADAAVAKGGGDAAVAAARGGSKEGPARRDAAPRAQQHHVECDGATRLPATGEV